MTSRCPWRSDCPNATSRAVRPLFDLTLVSTPLDTNHLMVAASREEAQSLLDQIVMPNVCPDGLQLRHHGALYTSLIEFF